MKPLEMTVCSKCGQFSLHEVMGCPFFSYPYATPLTGDQLGGNQEQDQEGASGGAKATERSKPRSGVAPGSPATACCLMHDDTTTPGSTTGIERSSEAYLVGYEDRRARRRG